MQHLNHSCAKFAVTLSIGCGVELCKFGGYRQVALESAGKIPVLQALQLCFGSKYPVADVVKLQYVWAADLHYIV